MYVSFRDFGNETGVDGLPSFARMSFVTPCRIEVMSSLACYVRGRSGFL